MRKLIQHLKLKATTPPRSPLARRMRLMIIALIIIFGGLLLFNIVRDIFIKRFFANFSLPAVTISSATAVLASWTPTISAVGTLVAINGVEVSPEVPGKVVNIYFQSGQMVKEGQALIQLDDRTDQQDLKNYNAQLKLSQLNYQRQIQLMKTNSTAQSSVDQASAQLQESEATAAKTQVLIDQKLIKAPFNGKIGIRNVNIGQYVSPGNGLVDLQSMNPLYVQFSLPEQHLKSLYANQKIQFKVDNYKNKLFEGKINAIDASVNNQTRNILVQGSVPNNELLLYPGMFANVSVLLPTQQEVVTIPQTAVAFSLYGDSVFIIKKEGKDENGKPILKVHRSYVTTGERKGTQIAILKGLKAGDEVVDSGQLKLEDGATVHVDNSVKLPEPSLEELKQNRS